MKLTASQKLQLAVLRGEAAYPPPVKAKRPGSRFNGALVARPADLAVRSKTGAPIGRAR